ncbi:hypothetical protein BJX65DRAFT_283746 [Aspergillus insuetus]
MAAGFQTRSLEPFQRAIQAISPEKCDAVFAYSILTIVHGIAVPELTYITRASSSAPTDTSSRLERIFVLFGLVQGTVEITKMFGQTLRRTFHRSEDYWAGSSTALETQDNEAFHRLHDINHQENDNLDLRKFQIMEAVIAQVKMCCQRYRGHQDPRSVVTWLAIVDREFVKCLREKDTLAVLVLVHWGLLLGQLDGKALWAFRFGLALFNEGLGILNRETHVHASDLTAAWLAYRNALSVFSHAAC